VLTVRISVPVLTEQHPATFGVYIHVPFCVQKCAYCSFYSIPRGRKWFDLYVEAVRTQIRQAARNDWCRGRRVETIFFGGGTPSLLLPAQLASLLQACGHDFACRPVSMETSLEVNPATIDYDGFVRLRRAGFNRVSIGVQSLVDRELQVIGRMHTADEAIQTVARARKAGFANLSLDLIYGLPGQDLASWQQTLERALGLAPDHLSVYELTLEQGTPLAARLGQGTLELPDEEEVLAMLDLTVGMVSRAGLDRYEISNYGRPGYACRHNINYWHNGSYLGFGPAAVSCMSGRRLTAVADVEQFCLRVQNGESVVVDQEELSREARFRETVIMGLRMVAGVSLEGLAARFGINAVSYYGETLARLLKQQLLEISGGQLRLTGQGLLLADSVMAELV
jgi:oxygen-independent coproporphyrinogen-3 oxidase